MEFNHDIHEFDFETSYVLVRNEQSKENIVKVTEELTQPDVLHLQCCTIVQLRPIRKIWSIWYLRQNVTYKYEINSTSKFY